MTVARSRRSAPQGHSSATRVVRMPLLPVKHLDHQLTFVRQVLAAVPHALHAYRRHSMLVLTDITWGSGALVVGGDMESVLVTFGGHPPITRLTA